MQRALLGILLLSATAAQIRWTTPVSHATWDGLLKKHVSEQGVVNYRGFIRDSVALNQYLAQLSSSASQEKSWSREDRLAYWINAYNAYTIQLIIRHYPLKSINDISKPGIKSPWDIPFIPGKGAKLTLNDIEHTSLRRQFAEPRIHFAIVCASQSCPKLSNEAFTGEKINEQLERATRDFLNDPSRNRITDGQAQVSQIFNWFKEDFTKEGSVPAFINRYARTKIGSKTPLTYLEYDWSLNDH
jgi:hypothetical protein